MTKRQKYRNDLAKQKSLENRIRTLSRQISMLQDICAQQATRLAWLEDRLQTMDALLPVSAANFPKSPRTLKQPFPSAMPKAEACDAAPMAMLGHDVEPIRDEKTTLAVDTRGVPVVQPEEIRNGCDVVKPLAANLASFSGGMHAGVPANVSDQIAAQEGAAVQPDLFAEALAALPEKPAATKAHVTATNVPGDTKKSAAKPKPKKNRAAIQIPEHVKDIAERMVATGNATNEGAAIAKMLELGAALMLREMQAAVAG